MSNIKYLILASIFVNIQATPTCTLKEDNLVCISNSDYDYELREGLVSDATTAKSVNLTSCGIHKVECEAFSGLASVKALDLSVNRIQKLDSCMFNGLNQLTYLDMSYNRIQQIPNGIFDTVSDIEVLYLHGNKIKTIQAGAFDKLTKLTVLNLAHNELISTELNSHMFDHTKHLKLLNLTKNDLSGAPDDFLSSLPSLESLFLENCFLKEVPSFAIQDNLRTLKHLSLRNNYIKNLNSPTTFANLEELQILELNVNPIGYVHDNVFAPLRKVKTIYMRVNRLVNVPDTLFQNLPKLVNVDLAFNGIEKIDPSTFRNSPIKNLNLSGNWLRYLPENFCQRVRDEGGRLTKFLFSHNPWQCGCLRELIEEVKALGLVYNTDKYGGQDAVCASGDSFTCVRK